MGKWRFSPGVQFVRNQTLTVPLLATKNPSAVLLGKSPAKDNRINDMRY
jgi:hypothetical protein